MDSKQQGIANALEYFKELGVTDIYDSSAETGGGGGREPRRAISEERMGPGADRTRLRTQPDVISSLEKIRADVGDCTRCKLHAERTHIVFGVGNPGARLMFVGEGPGRDEDLQGEPFVGRAGQLLTKIIEAMGLKRGDVYIGNVVKCRPPENRLPEPDEVTTCYPFLYRQIQAIRPEIIVALGSLAAQTLLQTKEPISRIRGKIIPMRGLGFGGGGMEGVCVIPTFHPAYLLRNPPMKKVVWEDMKRVMSELQKPAGTTADQK